GRSRVVPLHARVRQVLLQLPRNDERVLPTVRDRTLLAQLKRLARTCGLSQSIRVHSLRHYFCSMCANKGVPVFTTQKWLGHASSDMVWHYYTLSDQQSQSAMKDLGTKTMPGRVR
ncbi:MAG: tyrosine-type recombinase/integrase, partial [Planctomycetota bacterium]